RAVDKDLTARPLSRRYSITSSASASSIDETSRPSALAVLRIDDKLEFGRLLNRQRRRIGPRSIRSANSAARRDRPATCAEYDISPPTATKSRVSGRLRERHGGTKPGGRTRAYTAG